ncbi:hypothetical protein LA303_01920 [Candidatus Sulfidibacterium hydrothermale]|uniref:hypothetical protein n=1 Tax=Candidatus Sulfidibacterium hydrothermale TaxID=2875962 RepID=UPI001F0ADBD9|nr:hypothetical protein [Candidatus Sulfidibacterium hydrothermale]UBM62750.1 hypothetical protein LA303_01920 [Candidatus Sulfidibacterium hydrothermale]
MIKPVKTGIGVFLFVLLFFGIFSCKEDEPTTPKAPVDAVAKFIGVWHVTDSTANQKYDVTIERHKLYPQTKVYLYNFSNLSGRIDGEVIGNTLLIQDAVTGTPGYTIDEGTGTWISDSCIDFIYTLNDGVVTKVHQAVFLK